MTLTLDGSAAVRTVALARGGEVLASTVLAGGRSTPWFRSIDDLLQQAGMERTAIQRLAVTLGPGSYTGIRGTLAVAQGWQLARGTDVVGFGTAEACALTALETGWRGRLVLVIDAQRGEYYVSEFDLDPGLHPVPQPLQPLRIASRVEVEAVLTSAVHCAGPDDAARSFGGTTLPPSASALAKLAHLPRPVATSRTQLEPIYLRATTFVKAPPSRVVS